MALPARLNFRYNPHQRWKVLDYRESFERPAIWSHAHEALSSPQVKLEVLKLKNSVTINDAKWSPVYRKRRKSTAAVTLPPLFVSPVASVRELESDFCPVSPCPSLRSKSPKSPLPAISSASVLKESTASPISSPEPSGKPLLRRPIKGKCFPIRETDPIFVQLTRSPDLKPLQFETQAAAFKFYNLFYPLILKQMVVEEDSRPLTPNRLVSSPESPMKVALQRKMTLKRRVEKLNEMLGELDKEEGEETMVTELNSATFDPSKWSFSKVDQAALSRRVTIDAIMKELHNSI